MSGVIVPPIEGHPLREIWMTRGIGASAAEVILKGKTKFTNTRELFEYITKRREKEPQTEAQLEGLAYEPTLREWWQAKIGALGESVNLIDPEHTFRRAQIDHLTYEGTRACDFKFTRSEWKWKQIKAIADHTNLLTEGTKLDDWYCAAEHQLDLLDLPQIDYFICFNGLDTEHLIVKRDDEFIARLRAAECAFWNDCVIADKPPPSKKLTLKMDHPSNGKE